MAARGAFDWDDEEDEEFYKEDYKYAKIYIIINRDYNPYRVQFYDDVIYDINKKNIIRLLNDDEINEYELKKEALKYNL